MEKGGVPVAFRFLLSVVQRPSEGNGATAFLSRSIIGIDFSVSILANFILIVDYIRSIEDIIGNIPVKSVSPLGPFFPIMQLITKKFSYK